MHKEADMRTPLSSVKLGVKEVYKKCKHRHSSH